MRSSCWCVADSSMPQRVTVKAYLLSPCSSLTLFFVLNRHGLLSQASLETHRILLQACLHDLKFLSLDPTFLWVSGLYVIEHSIFLLHLLLCYVILQSHGLWAVFSSPHISHGELCSSRLASDRRHFALWLWLSFVVFSLSSLFHCGAIRLTSCMPLGSVALLWWLMPELVITVVLLIATTL